MTLVDDLKRDEGWSAVPYRDSEGFLTIGYGFLIDERKPVELPEVVGQFWLMTLAERVSDELDAALPWLTTQPQEVRRALQNCAYQMGISGLLGFHKMLDALKAGDRKAAADHLLDSIYAKQTPARAERCAALLRGD